MRFVFLSVFAAMVIVTDAMKEGTETMLRREMPAPHDEREKIEREAQWAERIERHEGTESAHERTSNKIDLSTNPLVDPIFDDNSTVGEQKQCLKKLVADAEKAGLGGKFALSNVCKDDESNEAKDDHGNYIRWTIWEDKVAVKIWKNTMNDCENGQSYLRDIVEGFASGISCFEAGTDKDVSSVPTKEGEPGKHMINKNTWKTSGTKLKLHSGNEVEQDSNSSTYKICEGAKDFTPNKLTNFQDKLKGLVKDYDDAWKATPRDKSVLQAKCAEMYMAHGDLKGFAVRDILTTSRGFVCNAKDGNPAECDQMEAWYMDFMNRNLFASGARDNKSRKGRAIKGAGGHSEACNDQIGEGRNNYKTDNHGITTEVPLMKDSVVPACLVDKPLRGQIINGDKYHSFKGGLYTTHMSGNILAKHFAFCDAPFVAGVSGTVPQYMMMAGGSPKKVTAPGYTFANALNDKVLMAIVGMLELAGFHSITELMLPVNFYRKQLLVVPPFDSGSFTSQDMSIRCHDTGSGNKPGCCAKEGLKSNSFNDQHNGEKYKAMMKQFEAAVDKWQERDSFSPQVVDKAVDQASPAAAGTASGNEDAGPGEDA